MDLDLMSSIKLSVITRKYGTPRNLKAFLRVSSTPRPILPRQFPETTLHLTLPLPRNHNAFSQDCCSRNASTEHWNEIHPRSDTTSDIFRVQVDSCSSKICVKSLLPFRSMNTLWPKDERVRRSLHGLFCIVTLVLEAPSSPTMKGRRKGGRRRRRRMPIRRWNERSTGIR